MTIPRPVERVIDEQSRVAAQIAGTLNHLAYIYGPGTEKVMDAVDRAIAAAAQRAAQRSLAREIATRIAWAKRRFFEP